MNEQKNDVPYIVYEGEMAKAERHIKRANINTTIALALAALIFIADRI